MGYRHETYDGNGNLIDVVDTRNLEDEKQRVITELKEQVAKEMEQQAPLFEQINALEGRYDATKAKSVRDKVNEIRGRYLAKRDAVLAMDVIEDIEKVGW